MRIIQTWPLLITLLAAGCASVDPDVGRPDMADRDAIASSPNGETPDTPYIGDGQSADESESVDDVWQRIRNGYAIPGHDNSRVTEQLRRYARQPDYWVRISERAAPYLFHIVEEVEARDMPLELALLPIVESAFRPFAYSHGRAAGIWQFVPATGRHYGLDQNWWYDGRRDVLAATDAALNYLTYLGDMFDGDWLLALAAYNAGEGTVSRAIKRNANAGRPTDYWSLDLPAETMAYVPRLLAISELVAAPATHGIALTPIPNEPVVEVVDLDRQIDLALVTELAEIEMDVLYALNPGYNRWATAPEGPHRLLLPRERAPVFRERLANVPQEAWMRWQRHQVASGETLGEIANRYHVTVSTLQEANNLNGHVIRAGSHLMVPMASRPNSAYSQTADARRNATQSAPRAGRARTNHVVQSGDSLWSIARRYGVNVRQLAQWNGMAPKDVLSVGDQLAVWTDRAPSDGTSTVGRVTATSTSPSERLQAVTYTVRQGDSLYRIAERFGVGVSDLRQWNELPEGAYLQPGQAIRMQVDVTAQSDL